MALSQKLIFLSSFETSAEGARVSKGGKECIRRTCSHAPSAFHILLTQFFDKRLIRLKMTFPADNFFLDR